MKIGCPTKIFLDGRNEWQFIRGTVYYMQVMFKTRMMGIKTVESHMHSAKATASKSSCQQTPRISMLKAVVSEHCGKTPIIQIKWGNWRLSPCNVPRLWYCPLVCMRFRHDDLQQQVWNSLVHFRAAESVCSNVWWERQPAHDNKSTESACPILVQRSRPVQVCRIAVHGTWTSPGFTTSFQSK